MNNIDWHKRAQATDLHIRNFINGNYVDREPAGIIDNDAIIKKSPRDGRLLYSFSKGCIADANFAVSAAKSAFKDGRWRNQSVSQRKVILQRLSNLIEKNKEEFALYESLDVGKPITNALTDDIPRSIDTINSSAEKVDKIMSPSGVDGSHFAYQLRKPLGVVCGITGWNFPLLLAAMKIGPALATGNSIILKPSEFTSLSTSRLAELAVEAGVPPGVFNVIHGKGNIVGRALTHHLDVEMVSFVGSSATGKQIAIASGQSNLKRMLLECGGKSPFLVFEDCVTDLDFVASQIVAKAFPNQGAVCSAGTRLLVQSSVKEQLLPRIIELTARITPQDPLSSNTTFGAIVNESHMKKVLSYIESGIEEGAKLIHGGNQVYPKPDHNYSLNSLKDGYYIEPTIFEDVAPTYRIAQEEIFGPVLSVITFKDEEEAIKIANGTRFGLTAYVATKNLGRAHRLSRDLNTGRLIIFGSTKGCDGYVDIGAQKHKESGFGYTGGLDGIDMYTTSSTIHVLT